MADARRSWQRDWTGEVWVIALGVLSLAASCSISPDRATCRIDVDCPDGELCYEDGRCLPPNAARQLGAPVGRECTHAGGAVAGCAFTCLMGFCDGPPEFGGAEFAVSDAPTALLVSWQPPTDETPPNELRYRVFVSETSGGQDFAAPTLTVTGGTSVRLERLTPATAYYVVVRVEDGFGQAEQNAHEVRGVPACIEYATQIEPLLADHCASCHGEERAERGLRLDSLDAVLAGTPGRPVVSPCRPERSRLVERAGPPSALDTRGPHGGLRAEQVELLSAWIGAGAQASCPIDAARCDDAIPPTFAGATRATALDASTVRVCWAAGADDRAPVEQLVYDVHRAPLDPARPPAGTSLAGDLCLTLVGQIPGEETCWTTRARDPAGNIDTNSAEVCVTMPEVPCLEYADVIQPIFDERCAHCHGGDAPLLRLDLTSYAGVALGGASGVVAPACDPDSSILLSRVGAEPPRSVRMPGDGPPYLSDAQIGAIRRWITEGARPSCGEPDPC